ncbi:MULTISPECIES: glutaredoxin domain-containing protein [Microbacterium]
MISRLVRQKLAQRCPRTADRDRNDPGSSRRPTIISKLARLRFRARSTIMRQPAQLQEMQHSPLVWEKPSCVQCTATLRALDAKGIPHRILDLTEHPDAITILKNANFMQAPFVQHGDDVWTGFRPDKIDAIAKAIA